MSLPRSILLATGNAHKIEEMRSILTPLLPQSVALLSFRQIGLSSPPDDVERFDTFTANSRAKAQWCRDQSGLPCIADDSGICIDALDGGPGIRSARWAGPDATAVERNLLLLGKLRQAGALLPEQRHGYFACSATYAPQSNSAERHSSAQCGQTISAFGMMRGYVLDDFDPVAASNGFGYDPILFSTDLQMSVAAAAASEKNRVSHRARALKSLVAAMMQL